MKKTICMVLTMSMLIFAAWPSGAWSAQEGGHSFLLAEKDITAHEPQIVVIEESDMPKAEGSWFSRNKWYILGGLVIAGGAAAAGSGGGSSGNSGGGSSGSGNNADTTVTW